MPTVKSYQQQRGKEEIAYNYFISQGYSPEASAGIVGNLVYESGLNTKAEGDIGFKGGSSFGIAQFRGQRLKNLKNRYGDKWTDFNNQLDFVRHELETTHQKAGNALKNSRDSYQAGQAFSDLYEIPAKKYKDNIARQKQVNRIYSSLGKTSQTPISDVAIANVNDYFANTSLPITGSTEVILDSPEETVVVEEAEDEDIKEVKKQTAEYNFLKDYQQLVNTPQQETVVQEQIEQPVAPMVNLQDIFANVSAFVDSEYAQQGGVVRDNIPNLQPRQLKDTKLSPKNYLELYLQSPVYLERLRNQGYSNPQNVANSRLEKLQDTGVYYQNPDDNILQETYRKFVGYTDANAIGSLYNPRTNTVTINEARDRKNVGKQGTYNRDSTETHELSHATDAGFPLNTADEAQLFRRLKGFQLDEDFRYQDREDMINNKIYNDLPHDQLPRENKADINGLRYILYKNGIYDTTKDGEFKQEHLNKVKNSEFVKNRLQNNYSDQDIIWLMNKIAQNDGQSDSTFAQQGRTIGNLTPEQTADVEKQREWLNNWNANRVIGGQKINSNYQIPFSSDIYIDDLNYGNNNRETTLGEFDTVSDRLILDTTYQSKQGIPAHELTHRYQKYLSPDLYNQYINEPISKALQNTQGSSEYHGNVDENQAELNRLRYIQGFRPDQTITPQNLQNYNPDEYNLKHFSQDQLINLLNTTAYTPNNNDVYYAQQGGLPISPNGVYDYPGQNVVVNTDNGRITMKNVNYPILGIDEYGNQQMMQPNQEYQFAGKTITEIPQLTKAEKAFLKHISQLK